MKDNFGKKSDTYKAFLAIPMFFVFVGASVMFLKSYEIPIEFGNKLTINKDFTNIVKMQMAASIQSEIEKMEEKFPQKKDEKIMLHKIEAAEMETAPANETPEATVDVETEGSFPPNYSKVEVQAMNAFAENIKTIVRNKDIVAFSELVHYPITLTSKREDGGIRINNKEEFQALGVNTVFKKDFIDNVCRDEEVFISWRGAMLGYGPNLFFDFMENKDLKINALNIDID